MLSNRQRLFIIGGLVIFFILIGIIKGCGGGNNNEVQNMPYGGTPFTGIFTPGIGNLTQGASIDTCNQTKAESETLTFQVNESGPTEFVDTSLTQFANIFAGNFTNPVSQNNPCFRGTITHSNCGYAQSGVINFSACQAYLLGSQYVFTAVYYLYAVGGPLIQSGQVYATK